MSTLSRLRPLAVLLAAAFLLAACEAFVGSPAPSPKNTARGGGASPAPAPSRGQDAAGARAPRTGAPDDASAAQRLASRRMAAFQSRRLGGVVTVTGGPEFHGAKFEPPVGRVLHGMGQWDDGNREYEAMLGDPALLPASDLRFLPIGDWPRDWQQRLQGLAVRTRDAIARTPGLIPHVDISLFGLADDRRTEVPIDAEVAASERYDERIRAIARLLRDAGGPVFMRIGAEFSGSLHDYSPFSYPAAFRRVVELVRGEGASNVAFVWCYEPGSPGDFDVVDPALGPRWYPGDDVVDWFAIDLFDPSQYTGPRQADGEETPAGRTARFLEMAIAHGRPVLIAECSAAATQLSLDAADGRADWVDWFEPFFEFLAANPNIKGFHYINCDWSTKGRWADQGWGEARVNLSPHIAQRWIAEIRKPKYLHRPDVALLHGYAEARAVGAPGGPAVPEGGAAGGRGGR